jgi:hypothetical protein
MLTKAHRLGWASAISAGLLFLPVSLSASGTRLGVTRSWPLGPGSAIAASDTYVYVGSGNAVLTYATGLPTLPALSQVDLHAHIDELVPMARASWLSLEMAWSFST